MKKKLICISILMLAMAVGVVMVTGCSKKKEETTKTTVVEEKEPVCNPLTGVSEEDGYDANAIKQRIVSFVVENHPDARPQWGMTGKKSPDILLQGEVEGGITRTLWLYADYNNLPKKIGPIRSARPPYIKFAKLFDAVFIHWGQSASSETYVGAGETFKAQKVNHINEISFDDQVDLFGRDTERAVSSEHTGIVHGKNVAAALKQKGFHKKSHNHTVIEFNEKAQPVGSKAAVKMDVTFSSRSFETVTWKYDKEDKKYHTDHFENDLKRTNLLILKDTTEYQTKYNYHGTGQSVTYCDYKLAGGKGKLLSQGTVRNIKWRVGKKHSLILIDAGATEKAKKAAEEAGKTQEEIDAIEVKAKLNRGKTWIGWISSNNGGKAKIYEE